MNDVTAPISRDEARAELTGPGQQFEIHEEDVRGERLQVFKNRQRALGRLLLESARFGEGEYLVTERSRLSFAEHMAAVAALAAALREEHAVQKGDRVAICAANCPEWVVSFFAVTSLGAIAVGLNSMWAGLEVQHGLELTEPRVVIADQPRRRLVEGWGAPVLSIEDDLPSMIERHRGATLSEDPESLVDEDDPAVILFTSGTTGHPKGATHSHRNVIGAVWFHLLNDAVATRLGAAPSSRRWLMTSPLFHIASLHNLAVVRLVVGDTAVVYLGKFDIDRALRLIEKERVTNWGSVPTMASRLVEHADRHRLDQYDLSALRTFTVNSAPSAAALKQRLREVLPAGAANNLGTTYGLTESSTGVTAATAADLAIDPETVGRTVATMEMQIRDERGHPVPEGIEGEICLRSPLVMLGYWRNDEATAAAITEDGWFRTGDLGVVVNGYLRISSRRSDLILRGGENVYPAEVEHALNTHAAVRECIVMGVPHTEWGEEVAAVVVLHSEASATAEELRDHLRGMIAKYKIPSRWTLSTADLPRNATGKVNRQQLFLT